MKFTITPAARAVLAYWAEHEDLVGHVPTIIWSGDVNFQNWEWGVGTYVRSEIPASVIVTLDGIEFAIEPDSLPRLEGNTLDYINGSFYVLDPSGKPIKSDKMDPDKPE